MVARRKFPWVNTSNLISRVTTDESGRRIFQEMSRSLDISKVRLIFGTDYLLESSFLSRMTVDVNNNLFEIQGELICCYKSDNAMYHSGVRLFGTNDQITQFITNIIKVYVHRKNRLYIVQSKS